jgi:hypothetical protein
MRLLSHDDLDFGLAWRRTRHRVRAEALDIPDRLPFEVLDRVFKDVGPPPARPDHHLAPVTLVGASKKSGLSRQFARLSPVDLVLYQALVDRLAPHIEAALPPRDVVFAYRQTLDLDEDAFAGTPGREAYADQMRTIVEFGFSENYAITADIAGYYMHVDVTELERILLTIAPTEHSVVRDLGRLLAGWQQLGVRGLPQGVRPSAPLANLYLASLDEMLNQRSVRHVRWLDDMVVATSTFSHARELLDLIERCLYDVGLTLAADKTRIHRYDVAVTESEPAADRLRRRKGQRKAEHNQWLEEAAAWMDYPPDEAQLPHPEELDREVVVEQFTELIAKLGEVDLPAKFQPDVIAALRELSSLEAPVALDAFPLLLRRAPDLTAEAFRYLTKVIKHDAIAVTDVFLQLLGRDEFMRDGEKLALCAGVLALPQGVAPQLAPGLAVWALEDDHALVRARSLLAWGAQSADSDFSVADDFWLTAAPPWRPYVMVAIQGKRKAHRNRRYDAWSAQGRFLAHLADTLRRTPIAFRKL